MELATSLVKFPRTIKVRKVKEESAKASQRASAV